MEYVKLKNVKHIMLDFKDHHQAVYKSLSEITWFAILKLHTAVLKTESLELKLAQSAISESSLKG